MTITFIDAIVSLRPAASWSCSGNTVASLSWNDIEQTKPTEVEISAEVSRLQAEYANKEYQRQRATAYPSIADQLDTIYHSGIDAWKATITAVKQEFPK